jgi:hypothetical protein
MKKIKVANSLLLSDSILMKNLSQFLSMGNIKDLDHNSCIDIYKKIVSASSILGEKINPFAQRVSVLKKAMEDTTTPVESMETFSIEIQSHQEQIKKHLSATTTISIDPPVIKLKNCQ